MKNKNKKVCRDEDLATKTVKWYPRHKWIKDFIDCSFCGGGEYAYCERCGEEKLLK